MSLSAASVAVMANNNTLENMGAMQQSFFELDGSTINAGLEATNAQAAAEEKSIMDQASSQQTQALGVLIGSGIGILSNVIGLYKGTTSYNEARALEQSATQMKASYTQVEDLGAELQTIKSSTVAQATPANIAESALIKGEMEDPSPVAKLPAAKVAAQLNSPAQNLEDSDAAIDARKKLQQNADAATETKMTENPQAKALRSSGDMWMQYTNTFGGLFSGVGKSGGELTAYNAMTDQAKQAKIRDLEQGLAGALNTQTGLINSQLGNLDQARGNTYQLMSTLQHVQG